MQLSEDAAYATLNVVFYQPERADIQIVMNPEYYTQNGFGTRLLTAINSGWQGLTSLFIIFCGLWPLLLLASLGLLLYKRYAYERPRMALSTDKLAINK